MFRPGTRVSHGAARCEGWALPKPRLEGTGLGQTIHTSWDLEPKHGRVWQRSFWWRKPAPKKVRRTSKDKHPACLDVLAGANQEVIFVGSVIAQPVASGATREIQQHRTCVCVCVLRNGMFRCSLGHVIA